MITSCFSQFFPDQNGWLGVHVFEVNFVFSFKKLLQNQWKEAKKSQVWSVGISQHMKIRFKRNATSEIPKFQEMIGGGGGLKYQSV